MVIDYLTAILVFVTAIYAWLTHRLAVATEASVEALKSQSETALRPYVTVAPFVRSHTPFLYLRISNTGRTSARNLRLTLDRDFFQWGESKQPDKNLRNMTVFSTPIDSFAPGAELILALGQGWVIFGQDAKPEITPSQFSVTAAYEFFGKSVEELNQLDLRPFSGTEGERDPIVEELERIRQALEKKT
jgi:hypothetical protein